MYVKIQLEHVIHHWNTQQNVKKVDQFSPHGLKKTRLTKVLITGFLSRSVPKIYPDESECELEKSKHTENFPESGLSAIL